MKTRFFAFGCSLTKHKWSTWADAVGLNFSQSINFGQGGASNYYIFNKFLEADLEYNFNPDSDVVGIMLTGVNRFSWKLRHNHWMTSGEIENIIDQPNHPAHIALKQFSQNMWNHIWAVQNTWIAALSIQKILKTRNIEHFILKGIEFDHYIENCELFDLDTNTIKNIETVNSITLNNVALETFSKNSGKVEVHFKKENISDGHPHPSTHLDFVKTYLPQYITPLVEEKFNYISEGFYSESIEECHRIWSERRKELCLT